MIFKVLAVFCIFSVIGKAYCDIECYYCYHGTGGASILTLGKEELDGQVLQVYNDYYDSVTYDIRQITPKYKTDLSVIPHVGEKCKTPVDINDLTKFMCEDEVGDGNNQLCAAIHIETKDGEDVWARGCMAQGICDLYGNQTFVNVSEKSKIHVECCDTANCNTHDVDASADLSSAWTRLPSVGTLILMAMVYMVVTLS